jgi:hypothetical protein
MTTDMPSKISTAKLMLQILGWLSIAFGTGMMLLFFAGAAIFGSSKEDGAMIGSALFGAIGLGFGIFAIGFGVLHLFTASAIAERKSWAKVCAIILAVLHVMNLPLGTVLAVFIFIGMFSAEADIWFVAD